MKSKWDGKIPYNEKTGSVPHYNYGWNETIWKDNHVFQDILSNFRFARGRSAAYAIADSQFPGREHVVFLKDLGHMIPLMLEGKIYGMFTYCKRGQNYGTKLDPNFLRLKST